MNRDRMYLTGTIALNARLLTSMASVRRRMSFYPAMRQLSGGGRLRYIIGADAQDRFNVVELERRSITLRTSSITSPLHFMKESVLRLLSVSMLLSEDYSVDFGSLVPYLIHLLSNSDQIAARADAPNFNRDADIILSRRIIDLSAQQRESAARLEGYRKRLACALSHLIPLKYPNGFERASMAAELGLCKEDVLDAIALLKARGYRVYESGAARVDVVTP